MKLPGWLVLLGAVLVAGVAIFALTGVLVHAVIERDDDHRPAANPATPPDGSEYRYQAKDGRWIHCLVLREQGHTIGSHCWWEP